MTLEDEIKENYRNRLNKNNLYNSVYSQFAQNEKEKKLQSLLNEFVKINKTTTLLEIGAGQGGNIPMLLNLGFTEHTIFANELLPERILAVKQKYPNIKIFEGDALGVNFNQKFDIVFQSTVFTSILKNNDRIILANKMWDALTSNGIILWYDFIYNNPNNSDVKKVDINEVKKLFPFAHKTKILKVTLAPPIGRRVGKLYNLFNIPPLRSHILVAIQKK